MAIIAIDVVVVISLSSPLYGRKQRPFEALNATPTAAPLSHPASASCSGIVTATVTSTTPSNANAATSAISASCC